MTTHHLPVTLPAGRKSRVWFARQPSSRAIIFVHGFGGDALDTWMRFPYMLPTEAACSQDDIYFYGYESLRRQVAYSAREFGQFLKQLITKPTSIISGASKAVADQRPPSFTYDRYVLVCHSMGAVIARRALLDLATQPAMRPHLSGVRLVLFAPAHRGARDLVALASEALGPFRLRIAPLALRFKWTVLDDLHEKSQAMSDLLADSEREYQRCASGGEPTNHLIAHTVVHAEFDTVVVQNKFLHDPLLSTAAGQSHTSVCKPTSGYLDPLQHVLGAL